jgi:hypothetical protein
LQAIDVGRSNAVKFESFTKGFVTNVRPDVVDELPPPKKQKMSPLWSQAVSHPRRRRSRLLGMRLDRIRSRPHTAASKQRSQLMNQIDDSEIKDWLREIRIEKIERILKPSPHNDETVSNEGF